jgi:hypothetical protein
MRSMRKVIVVVMLAGALCADRAASAAPQLRPQVVEIARGIAGKLTVGLRRVVPSVRLHEIRREGAARLDRAERDVASASFAPLSLSPFQFRLPPPLL